MRFRSVAAVAGFLALPGCSGGDGGGEKTGSVSLSVLLGGPIAGVDVYTHDRAGRLEGEFVTDSSGALVLVVPIGGMITASRLDGAGNRRLRTIGGVQDGDELTISFGTPVSVVNTPVVVLDSSFNGAEEYVVDAGSSSDSFPAGELSLSLPITSPCVNDEDTYDLLATAIDGDSNAVAWALLEDVPASTTTAYMPAWSTSFASKPISIVNGPPGFISAHGDLVEEGGDFDLNDSAFAELEDGSANVVLSLPSNFGLALATSYFVYDSFGPGPLALSLSYGRSNAIGDAVSLDFATDFYPYIGFADFESSVPEVEFAGAPTDADFIAFYANWDEGDHYVFWDMLLPPDATERVSAPELPDELHPSGSPYYLTLSFYDFSNIDGFDELRNGDFVSETEYWTRSAIIQQ